MAKVSPGSSGSRSSGSGRRRGRVRRVTTSLLNIAQSYLTTRRIALLALAVVFLFQASNCDSEYWKFVKSIKKSDLQHLVAEWTPAIARYFAIAWAAPRDAMVHLVLAVISVLFGSSINPLNLVLMSFAAGLATSSRGLNRLAAAGIVALTIVNKAFLEHFIHLPELKITDCGLGPNATLLKYF